MPLSVSFDPKHQAVVLATYCDPCAVLPLYLGK